jgi:hypothetical protein
VSRCLGVQLRVLKKQILEFDRMINAWHRSSETSKRLDKDTWCRSGVGYSFSRQRR